MQNALSKFKQIDELANELVAAPTPAKARAFNDLLLTALDHSAITTREFLALCRKTERFTAEYAS